tara:strand:+ start:89 stop:307 length:219 start_codon:yes stop_codon:yes gene_type:complete
MQEFNLEYKGILYTIKKDTSESIDVFLKRAWYIAKKKENCKEDFNKINELSLIWRNHKIYGMEYDPKILQLI